MRGSILVIKLSALGDLFFALPALQAIRRHHPGDDLVLLTAARFAPLMRQSGLFDQVWEDPRPAWWQPWRLLALRRGLRGAGFRRVYDLQWSHRSDLYLRLLGRRGGERVGATPAADLRFAGRRERRPIRERQAALLAQAGLEPPPPADLGFLAADLAPLALPARFALLAPGSSPQHPAKRWPPGAYAALAGRLAAAGLPAVVAAGPDDRAAVAEIARLAPAVRVIETSLPQLASLARAAAVTIGNDSGPTHLAALAGSPTVMLFGPTDPVKQRPYGAAVALLQADPIEDVAVEAVLEAAMKLATRIPPASGPSSAEREPG